MHSCTATTLQTRVAQYSKHTEPDKINRNVWLVLVSLLMNKVVGKLGLKAMTINYWDIEDSHVSTIYLSMYLFV